MINGSVEGKGGFKIQSNGAPRVIIGNEYSVLDSLGVSTDTVFIEDDFDVYGDVVFDGSDIVVETDINVMGLGTMTAENATLETDDTLTIGANTALELVSSEVEGEGEINGDGTLLMDEDTEIKVGIEVPTLHVSTAEQLTEALDNEHVDTIILADDEYDLGPRFDIDRAVHIKAQNQHEAVITLTSGDGAHALGIEAEGVTIEGLKIIRDQEGEAGSYGQGIKVLSSDATIIDNKIVGVEIGEAAGIHVRDPDNKSISNITIEGNTVTGFDGEGENFPSSGINVVVRHEKDIEDVAIRENTLDDNYVGINIAVESGSGVISVSDITDNTLKNYDGTGIYIGVLGDGQISVTDFSDNTFDSEDPDYHIAEIEIEEATLDWDQDGEAIKEQNTFVQAIEYADEISISIPEVGDRDHYVIKNE